IGIIGEYHLKLEFNQSQSREVFYTSIQDIRIALANYGDILAKLDEERMNVTAQARLKMESQAEYRNVINKMGNFYRKIFKFLDNLVKDFVNGGNLIINPHDKLHLDKDLAYSQVLEGCTVIEGLKDFHNFLSELLEYHNFPDLKGNENDLRSF
ncbi:MAG: hypothetical protein OEZ36_07915, partial [Spirochaetota bacterium]|nr:hypothetical protein [Spirochaetota bacterium]